MERKREQGHYAAAKKRKSAKHAEGKEGKESIHRSQFPTAPHNALGNAAIEGALHTASPGRAQREQHQYRSKHTATAAATATHTHTLAPDLEKLGLVRSPELLMYFNPLTVRAFNDVQVQRATGAAVLTNRRHDHHVVVPSHLYAAAADRVQALSRQLQVCMRVCVYLSLS
jgi:hypothetical protein